MKTQQSNKSNNKEKWSAEITAHSNALDLDKDIFESKDPRHIAESLKRSAEKSKRRKTTAFQSAMSMLTFYINRAGKNLDSSQKEILEEAKNKLRAIFGREPKKD